MATMNLIDISSHQGNIDISKLKGVDGVIVKATEGTSYVNPYFTKQANAVLKAGLKLGLYHFQRGGDPKAEADFFLKTVNGYIGKAFLFDDFESAELNSAAGVAKAKVFLDRIKEKTGGLAGIYTSLSWENSLNFSSIAKANHMLWLAQYNNYNQVQGFQPRDLYGSLKYWKSMGMFQYTSSGRLSGYNANLDFNVFYGDKAAWDKYVKSFKAQGSTAPSTPNKPSTPAYSTSGKTVWQMADDVLKGKVGNGAARAKALGKYNTSVQAVVNELTKAWSRKRAVEVLVAEVKKNVFGSGDTRKKVLGQYYNEVQAVINKAAQPAKVYYKVKSGDTVSAIAAKYKVTSSQIVRLTGLSNPNKIYVGQYLRIK